MTSIRVDLPTRSGPDTMMSMVGSVQTDCGGEGRIVFSVSER